MNNEESFGFLQIRASTARGALPIEGAQVYISKNDRGGVIASGRTDRAGLTRVFTLPAPPKGNSEAPGIPDPYATYNVEIIADGFYPLRSYDVPIFPGVVSLQPGELVPRLGGGVE